MAQRWTGYTSGTQNLLSSVIENKKLALQAQAQADTASYRKQATEFAEAEKRRDDKFRSDTLIYRAEERERADEIRLTNTKRLDAADERDFQYQTKMLASRLITAKQNSMANWGVDVLDEEGKPLPTTIVDPEDSTKRIPNPTLVSRGANFSPDGTRLISVQESVADRKIASQIDATLGVEQATHMLEKIRKAERTPLDVLSFDPKETSMGGFDEEPALENLYEQSAQWGEIVDLFKVLPDDNAKKMHLLNTVMSLRKELGGERYESATAWYALGSKRSGAIRSSLESTLETYIKDLGGEIDKVNGKDSGLIGKVGEETSYEGVSFKDAPRAERGRRDMLKRKLREISQKESGSPLTAEERSYIRETGQIPDRLISAYNSGAY